MSSTAVITASQTVHVRKFPGQNIHGSLQFAPKQTIQGEIFKKIDPGGGRWPWWCGRGAGAGSRPGWPSSWGPGGQVRPGGISALLACVFITKQASFNFVRKNFSLTTSHYQVLIKKLKNLNLIV